MTSELRVDKIHNEGGDNDSGINLATNDSIKFDIAGSTKAEVDSSGHAKIDTIKGYTSAASVSLVGEGGSTTTNLQQGVAKCWGSIDGDAGTVVYFDSFNLSGITDNGTGDYTFAINNDMSSTSYTLQMSSNMGGGSGGFNGAGTIAAGTYQFYAYTQGGSFRDVSVAYTTVHGDLA
tara:strand:+ start:17 stop:547 length:531 start_codon:yes stop_codon:yes gene_type:complete